MTIDRVRRELEAHGMTMHVVDDVENPLVYGNACTELINRSKIMLNAMQVWYDNSFHMRFHMAAGNRAMVVSEHLPPHYPEYIPGIHYASVESVALTDTIVHYLEHEMSAARLRKTHSTSSQLR